MFCLYGLIDGPANKVFEIVIILMKLQYVVHYVPIHTILFLNLFAKSSENIAIDAQSSKLDEFQIYSLK